MWRAFRAGVLLLAISALVGNCSSADMLKREIVAKKPSWSSIFRPKSPVYQNTMTSRFQSFLPSKWRHIVPEESVNPSHFHALETYLPGKVFRAAFKALTLQGVFETTPGSLSYYRRHLYHMAVPVSKMMPLHTFDLNELRVVVRSLWNCDDTSALRSIKLGITKPRHRLFLLLARRQRMLWRTCAASGASTDVMVKNRLLYMGLRRSTIANLSESERVDVCNAGFSCWMKPRNNLGYIGSMPSSRENIVGKFGSEVAEALDKFMLLKTLQWGYGVPSKVMRNQTMASLKIAKDYFEGKARASSRLDLRSHPLSLKYKLPKLPEEKGWLGSPSISAFAGARGEVSGSGAAGAVASAGGAAAAVAAAAIEDPTEDQNEPTDFGGKEIGGDAHLAGPHFGLALGVTSVASMASDLATSSPLDYMDAAVDDTVSSVDEERLEQSVYEGERDGDTVYAAVKKFRTLAEFSTLIYSRDFAAKLDRYLDPLIERPATCPRINTKLGRKASVGDLFRCLLEEVMPDIIKHKEAIESERALAQYMNGGELIGRRVVISDAKRVIERCVFPDLQSQDNWEGLPEGFLAKDGYAPENYKKYALACREALQNLDVAIADSNEDISTEMNAILGDLHQLLSPANAFYSYVMHIDDNVLRHGSKIMYLAHLLRKLSGRLDKPCEYSKDWVECALADIYMSSYFTASQLEKRIVKELHKDSAPDEQGRLVSLIMSENRESSNDWKRCKDKLSEAERESVTRYTRDGFKSLNPFLRNYGYPRGEKFSVEERIGVVSNAALVSSGLSKMPARSDLANGKVRIRFTNLESKYQREQLQEDGVFGDMGFFSSSVDKNWKWSGKYKLLIDDVCNEASYQLGDRCLSSGRFLSPTGALVRALSTHEQEMEVLYMPGTLFSVKSDPTTKNEDDDGGHEYEVQLEEIIDIGI